ncbi:MAG: DUF1598 domain-containing protein [Thermoguttaceae bacterium]
MIRRNLGGLIGVFAVLLILSLVVSVHGATAEQSGYSNSGVLIDSKGVLSAVSSSQHSTPLNQQRIQAALSALPRDLASKSPLRLVSLNRLEQEIIRNNGVITDEMRYLAGLQRAQYVFYYPETGDIVIGGPAEGWVQSSEGVYVGATTGHPVLELQDVVVALRTFAPRGTQPGVVGCSIDPTEEGLAAMRQFVRNTPILSPNPVVAEQQKMQFMNGVQQTLGFHTIRVDGVSPSTHLAQVLVAADYRMKLIGLGLEHHPGLRLIRYVDKADPALVSQHSLARWYFVPDYNCVKMTEDRLGMELVGNGVKLVDEAELVSQTGERTVAGKTNRASKEFVNSFTKQYSQIAQVAPVYAQLRNVIDLLICAAHIQKEGYYAKSGWDMEFFGSEDHFGVENYTIPQKVDSVVTRVENVNKGLFSVPVSGGVVIQPELALETNNAKPAEQQQLSKALEKTQIELQDGQWWWNAPKLK